MKSTYKEKCLGGKKSHFYFPTVAFMFHEYGNYKIANRAERKSWRSNDYRQQHYIIYIRLAKKLDLNYSHHKKKEKVIMWYERGVS